MTKMPFAEDNDVVRAINAWRNRCGRITRADVSADEGKPAALEKPCEGGETNLIGEHARARRRIATLERTISQQLLTRV